MKREQIENLANELRKDKRFIRYNNGNEIKTIVLREFDGGYNFLVNEKFLVIFGTTQGNQRRYNYMSITKQPAKWVKEQYKSNTIKFTRYELKEVSA